MRTSPSIPRPQSQISYDDAMSTLQAMFPGTWNREQLDQMLKANHYNMELTIESLLAMPVPLMMDTQGESTQVPLNAPQGLTRDAELIPQTATSTNTGRRSQVIVLPDDFLRVPGSKRFSESEQIAMDEQIATMLSDERFLRELQHNPEYQYPSRRRRAQQPPSSSLRRPSASRQQAQQQQHHRRTSSANRDMFSDDVAQIRKGLTDMGDNMKRRMTDLYKRFLQATTNNGGLNQSHVPLRDEGEDDEEVVLFTQPTATGRAATEGPSTSARRRSSESKLPPDSSFTTPSGVPNTSFQQQQQQYLSEEVDDDEEEILIHSTGTKMV